jgi:hypothetical protein
VQMTRERLEGYQKVMKEIKILRLELDEMVTTDSGLGHSVIFDYRDGFPRPQAVVGFDGERYDRKRRQLDRKETEAAGVREWIEDIEDAVIRQVFKLYYIDGCGWAEVAKRTGYQGNPDYPRLYIRDKYLKVNDIK